MDVWGYSASGWSPIMLRLNGLYVDEDPSVVGRDRFVRRGTEIGGPVYEFLYLDGTIRDGKVSGKWTAPPMSATNAVLLWPDALRYFFDCIRATSPSVLGLVSPVKLSDELEDYLDLKSPRVRAAISTSHKDYASGKSRPAAALLGQLKSGATAKRAQSRRP
jgi:hypothetical protein